MATVESIQADQLRKSPAQSPEKTSLPTEILKDACVMRLSDFLADKPEKPLEGKPEIRTRNDYIQRVADIYADEWGEKGQKFEISRQGAFSKIVGYNPDDIFVVTDMKDIYASVITFPAKADNLTDLMRKFPTYEIVEGGVYNRKTGVKVKGDDTGEKNYRICFSITADKFEKDYRVETEEGKKVSLYSYLLKRIKSVSGRQERLVEYARVSEMDSEAKGEDVAGYYLKNLGSGETRKNGEVEMHEARGGILAGILEYGREEDTHGGGQSLCVVAYPYYGWEYKSFRQSREKRAENSRNGKKVVMVRDKKNNRIVTFSDLDREVEL